MTQLFDPPTTPDADPAGPYPASRLAITREFEVPDIHVPPSEEASPWVPWGDNAAIRHLAFDVRNNKFSNILWVKGGGRLGVHRHSGAVRGFCLEGSWRYKEYDWVATPGAYVHENPGVQHTLVCDDPNGMKTLFWMEGTLEFYDDHGALDEMMDVFWFIEHYVTYCRAHGIGVNDALFV
ncbi:2,4'-dihydroxyacetophenone dioxygenase family protein [Pseudonocardia sp. ICBG1122]|nr:2,4'-dihydroxyacetophenone dioxygenase family protein [Pseudonocardia pini]